MMLEAEKERELFLFFPHGNSPIQLADKEVTFTTRIGPMELKAKFALKEMLYHGQLAL
jgi:hypothetical protein